MRACSVRLGQRGERDAHLTPFWLPADSFFGNVCELDLLFNFHKVYSVLDEVFLAGEIQETSKSVVLSRLEHLEALP